MLMVLLDFRQPTGGLRHGLLYVCRHIAQEKG